MKYVNLIKRITVLPILLLLPFFVAVAQKYEIVSDNLSLNKDYRALVVHYESVAADCKTPVMLSGLITIPVNQDPLAMVLDNHQTSTGDDMIPSVLGSPILSGSFLCGKYMVVAPDYLGYGLTIDQPHPYLCSKHTAMNCVDFAKVARCIVKDLDIKLELDTLFNTGYSQGGGVALAVHRQLENDKELAKELHFAGSYCGDGPYDLIATFNLYFNEMKEDVSLPFLLPLVAKGFLAGSPECFSPGRKFDDFFSQKVIDAGVEDWIDSKTGLVMLMLKFQLYFRGSTLLSDYLSEAMMDSESDVYKEFFAAAEKNGLLDGWKATLPLTIYHEKNDDVVPVVNAYAAIDSLGLDRDEQMITDMSNGNHGTAYLLYYNYVANTLANVVQEMINERDAIDGVWMDNAKDAPIYNLAGQRINEPKGLCIKKGRVFVQK